VRQRRQFRTARLARKTFSLEGVKWAAALAGLVALGGGAAFASLEHVSTAKGLWWAVSTMTTVGYGDVFPTTGPGQVLAVCVMVVGIGFVAFLTAAVAQRFVAQIEEPKPKWEHAVLSELREIKTRLSAIGRLTPQRGA
jgi:voltage-gated potassium channel